MSGMTTNSSDHPPAVVLVNPSSESPPSTLVSIDSPAMRFAFQLAAEIFPGAVTDVQVMSDPDEPSLTWYSLNIRWNGEAHDSLERDLIWHRRFEEAFPEVAAQFCLSSVPA